MLDSAEVADAASGEAAPREGVRRSFQPYHSQSVPKPENLQATATVHAGDSAPVTTMMLRNIPNKYTQASLLQEIDELGFAGSYDFFYLPMDVHNRSNVGYAFINFCLPPDAARFRTKFSDHRFQRFQSRKISSVCSAYVQGLDANLNHFKNRAVTHAKNGQYRPVVLKNNVRVEFEDAVAEACRDPAPQPVPAPLEPPPGLEGAGQWEIGTGRQEGGLARQGLELAIRDLARALAVGHAKQPAPLGHLGDSPAYVRLPGCHERLGSEEKVFSRCVSEGSTRAGFSREATEGLSAAGSPALFPSI